MMNVKEFDSLMEKCQGTRFKTIMGSKIKTNNNLPTQGDKN